MREFIIGDVVELNSGGPEMVVTGYERVDAPWSEDESVDKNRVWCRWYHPYSGNFENAVFNAETLSSVASFEPDEKQFEIGNIVELNAEGGPDMTVSGIEENTIQVSNGSGGTKTQKANDDAYLISCTWWNENDKSYHKGTFHYQTIIKKEDGI